MKLTIVLIFTACLHVSAESYSQKVSLSVQNEALGRVFKKIEKQTGYHFYYKVELVEAANSVSVNVRNSTLEAVLDYILKDEPLNYTIVKKDIIISEKPKGNVSTKPQKDIKGKVADEQGHPIQGATVTLKGTQKGTATDEKGEFSLSNIENTDILVISSIGYHTVETSVSGRSTINVTLKIAIKTSTEIVINTGIFERSKQTFTGASTSFKGEDLRNITNQNILSALSIMDPSFKLIENNLAGSDPNQLPDFQIRGPGSIKSNLNEKFNGNPNIPMFMLDGFEVSLEKIYDLDPQRILDVTILKDAAALSIYGSRGSNGVVVITTTPPTAGQLRLTYNFNLNFEAADLSGYSLLNGADKLEYERLAGLYTPNSYISNGESYSFYYNERLKLVKQGNNTDWLSKPVKDLGVNTKHAITLEGGDRAFRYEVNMSYNPSAGIMKGSGRDRKGISAKLNYNVKNLRFFNQMTFDNVKVTNSPYGNFSTYAYLNPYYNPYDENGELKKVLYNIRSVRFPTVVITNPMYNATINTKDESRYDNFINNFGMEWKMNRELKFDAKFSINKKTQITDIFKPSDHTDFMNLSKKGSYYKATGETFQYEGSAGINYTKRLDRSLIVLNGNYNIQEIKNDLYSITASGFPNDQMDHIGMGLEFLEGTKPQGYESTTRLMGMLGSLNYSYDNRFLGDFSIRYDGSSQFGSDKRWGAFWSAGLGWNLHQEMFVKNLDYINVLRLRGSIGYTGSQNFYPYQSILMYQYLTNITYDNNFGAVVDAYGNTNLKWQRTQKRNIGLDFELFKSKVNGYVNFYSDYSRDVLVDVTLPPSLGFDTYKANLGEVQNKGFEVYLRTEIISNPSSKFYWNVFGSVVHNSNKLNKISNSLRSFNDSADSKLSNKPSIRYVEGQSMNTIWVVKSLGIDPATGEEVFLDKNGNITNEWSSANYIPYGNTDASVEGTIGTNVGYKGFQLNVHMMYNAGGDIYNNTLVNRVENVDPNYNVDSRVFYDRWKKPGDIADFKGITNRSITRPTSRFVERENTVELKSVNLSYTISEGRFLSKLGLERARVSGYLNDVFRASTVKDERGINYPYSKHYALALQVIF
ncbi:MAG: SusC/RagA family TonB-linked outer membrane protein [Ginsengibacter sp.]